MEQKEHYDAIFNMAREVIILMAGKDGDITPEMAFNVLAIAYITLVRSHPEFLESARSQLENVMAAFEPSNATIQKSKIH